MNLSNIEYEIFYNKIKITLPNTESPIFINGDDFCLICYVVNTLLPSCYNNRCIICVFNGCDMFKKFMLRINNELKQY